MTDELRKIYGVASKMDRYFDTDTPIDLFRGKSGALALMVPTLMGVYNYRTVGKGKNRKKVAIQRDPDVLIVKDSDGMSPQYKSGGSSGEIVADDRDTMALSAEMVKNPDGYMVKGCRTMAGHHRGLSVFDGIKLSYPFDWYLITKGTKIPPGLAVTQDAPASTKTLVHHTVAPKDDMALSLYLTLLTELGAHAAKTLTADKSL